jgi:polar amino acid transport system substrate-binding protein
MKGWKFLALAALLLLASASLAQAGPTYDKVMKDKVVRIGLMTDSIPAGFYDEKKDWVGFDVDIADEIAKRLGAKPERVVVNNKTRIAFLQQGTIDFSAANMTHKREREQSIDFSITYFFDGQKIMAKKGQFKDLKDFKGKKIATMQGTTSEVNIKNFLKQLGDPNAEQNVISFQKESECFQALQMGRVAGWSTDSTILIGYAGQAPGQFELVGDFISEEPYGLGLPQNDSAWRNAVNAALQDMWRDGTYTKIYNKWYGPDTKYPFPMTKSIELWP